MVVRGRWRRVRQAETSWTPTCLSRCRRNRLGWGRGGGGGKQCEEWRQKHSSSTRPGVNLLIRQSGPVQRCLHSTCDHMLAGRVTARHEAKSWRKLEKPHSGTVMMLMMQPSGPSKNILAGGRRRVSPSSESLGCTWLVTNHILVYWMLPDAILKSISM